MTIFVWALDPNNAIERSYDCQEYKELAEALRKKPINSDNNYKLFQIDVKEIPS